MTDEALARKLIGRYLEERRDEALSRPGAPEAKGSAERAWEKWWSTGELDRETAARVLVWATDRARQASRARHDVTYRLIRAQLERHALVQWLAEHGDGPAPPASRPGNAAGPSPAPHPATYHRP
ncbi:hypothetical protein [Streptomyces decoyicus]|uniref:hypothetical protein n=1 Tax=Streptomyces decoyicus TaxID=249567 RepID=UPI003812BDA0